MAVLEMNFVERDDDSRDFYMTHQFFIHFLQDSDDSDDSRRHKKSSKHSKHRHRHHSDSDDSDASSGLNPEWSAPILCQLILQYRIYACAGFVIDRHHSDSDDADDKKEKSRKSSHKHRHHDDDDDSGMFMLDAMILFFCFWLCGFRRWSSEETAQEVKQGWFHDIIHCCRNSFCIYYETYLGS